MTEKTNDKTAPDVSGKSQTTGSVSVRDQFFDVWKDEKAVRVMCAKYGITEDTQINACWKIIGDTLGRIEEKQNRELYGNVPYWLYEQMCECEVKE